MAGPPHTVIAIEVITYQAYLALLVQLEHINQLITVLTHLVLLAVQERLRQWAPLQLQLVCQYNIAVTVIVPGAVFMKTVIAVHLIVAAVLVMIMKIVQALMAIVPVLMLGVMIGTAIESIITTVDGTVNMLVTLGM